MTSNLMSFCNHASYHSSPRERFIINCSLSKINTGYEECSMHPISSKQVHNVVGIEVWPIVKSDGNGSGFDAVKGFNSIRYRT